MLLDQTFASNFFCYIRPGILVICAQTPVLITEEKIENSNFSSFLGEVKIFFALKRQGRNSNLQKVGGR